MKKDFTAEEHSAAKLQTKKQIIASGKEFNAKAQRTQKSQRGKE